MKKRKNGFTLIELLAVIIILGILMIIAIPSVTSYINNSRKSAYVDTAKEIVAGARNLVNEGKLEMFDTDTTYYIPASCIKTENGSKSPYGEFDVAYVLVTYDGKGYNYYWVSRDETGQGVKDPIAISDLDEDDIESDIAFDYIKEDKPQEEKNTIKVLKSDNCNEFKKESTAAEVILETALAANQLNQIPNTDIYIFKGGTSAPPSNYVKFNNEDWRIIGIYGNQMKIQRTATIGKQKYNNSTESWNIWSTSDIKTYLNTTYYGTITDETARNMIDNTAEWNVGKASAFSTPNDVYTSSTGTKWKGTDTSDPGIGLMASYEFLYASGGDNCLITAGNYGTFNTICGTATNDWMKPYSNSWTLSGDHSKGNKSLCVFGNGGVSTVLEDTEYNITPVVFLKSSVKVVSGNGQSPSTAYILK